jgi:glucosylceramidase
VRRLLSLSIAALIVCPLPSFSQTVDSYTTSADLSIHLQQQPKASFTKPSTKQSGDLLTVAVDDKQVFQTIEGFGGSITDGTSWLLGAKISSEMKDEIMTALFHPTHGIGLSFLRQPLGATDLSREPSTFDDVPPGEQDLLLHHFSIAHDEQYTLPLLRQALKLNPKITVMLSPWSAPAWMKKNSSLNGGELRGDALPFYAKYLTRSIQSFQASGVPVKYLTVQNEPLFNTPNYPGSLIPASQAATLIGSFLGPELEKSGLKTKVLAYDHNWDHPEYPLSLLENASVTPYLAGSALHCYGGNVAAQNEIHARFPDKGIWLTECSGGTWDKEPALFKTARLLIESTRDWAKAVSLWGLVLDSDHGPHSGGCGTCRGLVTLDLHTDKPTASYTGDYYALGHASKFAHPGAARIASTSYDESSLQTVAFQNIDHSIVLLVLNNLDHRMRFTVTWAGKELSTSIEPSTLATYIWQP